MDNQTLFNRRELILYFWVKTFMGNYPEKALLQTAKPRKIYTEILSYPGM